MSTRYLGAVASAEGAKLNQSVRKAIMLLRATAEDRNANVSSLARAAGLPRATALRMIQTLEQEGFLLRIPGDLDPHHAAELEEAVWQRMSFASHLRIRRLGEFTVGTDLFRSDSLALVQLLILYHVVTARAALSIGGSPPLADPRFPTGADSALHA